MRTSRAQRSPEARARLRAHASEDDLHERVEEPADAGEGEHRLVVHDGAAARHGLDRDRVARDEAAARLEHDANGWFIGDDLVGQWHVAACEASDELEAGTETDGCVADASRRAHAGIPLARV